MSNFLGTAVFQHDWEQNIIFGAQQLADDTKFDHTFSFNSTGSVVDAVFYDERSISGINSIIYDLKNLTYNLLNNSVNLSYTLIHSMLIRCTGLNCWVSGIIANSGDNTILGLIEAPTGDFPYGIMHKLPYMIIKPTGINITAMTGITIHNLNSGTNIDYQIGIIGFTG